MDDLLWAAAPPCALQLEQPVVLHTAIRLNPSAESLSGSVSPFRLCIYGRQPGQAKPRGIDGSWGLWGHYITDSLPLPRTILVRGTLYHLYAKPTLCDFGKPLP
jgi:hypothetical protein